jgi:hypothetical protein
MNVKILVRLERLKLMIRPNGRVRADAYKIYKRNITSAALDVEQPTFLHHLSPREGIS